MEETGVTGENHRPAASHWQTLSHNVVHLDLSGIRTHVFSAWWCALNVQVVVNPTTIRSRPRRPLFYFKGGYCYEYLLPKSLPTMPQKTKDRATRTPLKVYKPWHRNLYIEPHEPTKSLPTMTQKTKDWATRSPLKIYLPWHKKLKIEPHEPH